MAAPLRILITGVSGCAGFHLSELAMARSAVVYGLGRREGFPLGVIGHVADIRRADEVNAVVTATKPDWVFHLAARIPDSAAETLPDDYVASNVTGTHHLLDAVRRIVPTARVLVASSSAVYGRPIQPDQAIAEDARLQPQSLYAVTKVAQDMLATQFFAEHGVHTIRGRTFNQTGPREPAGLVCATLARQIARIEAGAQEPVLRAVTLVPRRDFTDVRDVVAGYWAAVEHGTAGQAYNICSGRSVAVRQIAEILVGLSQVRDIKTVEIGSPPGPQAILNQIGDAARLRGCSGWQPHIPFEASLRDLLDDCRMQLKNRSGA